MPKKIGDKKSLEKSFLYFDLKICLAPHNMPDYIPRSYKILLKPFHENALKLYHGELLAKCFISLAWYMVFQKGKYLGASEAVKKNNLS